MIRLTEQSANKVTLSRTVRGSMDCKFSDLYSEITALNLALLASEAYSDGPAVDGYLNNTVKTKKDQASARIVFRYFSAEEPISTPKFFEHVSPHSYIDTQGFSFEDPENLYIAFRGTEPAKIRDWLTDADGVSVKSELCHGHVHGGFHAALKAVIPKLTQIMAGRTAGKNIIITGHSLGGALATLCAAWVREHYTDKVMLYTYGSPRAGCKDFVDHYSSTKKFPAFRVANPTDLVPSVPWDTASRDAKRLGNAPLVVLSPIGWIIVAKDEIHESGESMRYKHLGTPVSLQAAGFSIVGSKAHLDGEFLAGVQKDWQRMTLSDFLHSRSSNINHHFMTEYLPRLRKDFLDDCKNWAHGDPKPFQEKLVSVDRQLAQVDDEIRHTRESMWKQPAKVERDHTGVSGNASPYLPHDPVVSPEQQLRDLEAHRAHLQAQHLLLKGQSENASAEGRQRSFARISRRPLDGYLEEELLRHAG
jgi:hypothetical protein